VSRVRALRVSRDELVDLTFTAALAAVAVVGFRTVYGGWGWTLAAGMGLAGGLLVGYVAAATRQRAVVVALLVLAAALLLSGPVLPDTAVAGVVPTPATLSALVDGGVHGWVELLSVVPPVGDGYHLLAAVYLATLVCVAVGYVLARRCAWPGLAVLPPIALLAVGILFGTSEAAAPVLQGGGLAVLALAWLVLQRMRSRVVHSDGRRSRRLVSGLAILAVSAGVGVFAGPGLPGIAADDRYVLRNETVPPFDPHDYPSPLAGFRRFVTDEKKKAVLSVTGLPAGTRIRLASMDAYDGLVWSVAGGSGPSAGSSGWFDKVASELPSSTDLVDRQRPGGTTVTATITNRLLAGVWLPLAGTPTHLDFGGDRAGTLRSAFRYNRVTDTAATPTGIQPGDQFLLRADLAKEPTLAELAGHAVMSATQPPLIGVPDSVKGVAGQDTSDSKDFLGRVTALRKALVDGYYSDGGQGEVTSLPGHGAKRMDTMFGQTPFVGDEEQYAAAMGLMTRTVGVPVRVVVGFVVNPKHPQEILGSDASAWVEVPVEGYGWVPVDVTPDRNRTMQQQKPKPRPQPKPQVQAPPPPPAVAPDQEAHSQQQTHRTPKPSTEASSHWADVVVMVLTVGSPVLLLLLVVALISGAKAWRRRRRRTRGRPTTRVAGGWREIVDLARDLGEPVPAGATRREGALALAEPRARALAEHADSCVFGPGEPGDSDVRAVWDEVGGVRTALMARVSWRRRWRARLNTASFRHR